MGFRIKVANEDPDHVDINKLLPKRERFGELHSVKFGLGLGFSLALFTGISAILASLGIFSLIAEHLFEIYGLNVSYGLFGVVISMFYSFIVGFIFGTITAMIYDSFL